MNGSSWYNRIVCGSQEITQGDIIFGCQAIKPIVTSVAEPNNEIEAEMVEYDGIILTQACDIEQSNIGTIIMCPIKTIGTLIAEEGWSLNQAKSQFGNISKNQMPAFFLLNRYQDDDGNGLDYTVADFKNIFSIPVDVLRSTASQNPFRLRLKSPYRESLSQAFARFFMRVGLPESIEKAALNTRIEQYYSEN